VVKKMEEEESGEEKDGERSEDEGKVGEQDERKEESKE
jgi:hypothetical protein